MAGDAWRTVTVHAYPAKPLKPMGGKDKDGFINLGLMREIDIDDNVLYHWCRFFVLMHNEEAERKLYTKIGNMIEQQLYKEVNKFFAHGTLT